MATGGAVGIGDRQVEAALEEAPGHAGGVEQIADVLAAHLKTSPVVVGAGIADRIGIADQRIVRRCRQR